MKKTFGRGDVTKRVSMLAGRMIKVTTSAFGSAVDAGLCMCRTMGAGPGSAVDAHIGVNPYGIFK